MDRSAPSTHPRQSLSVAIIAQDEEQNLSRTLASVAGLADEIVLVDSGSTDATAAVATSYGARVWRHSWEGFGAQKNFALSQCRSDWVLSIDADEVLSPELARAIAGVLVAPASGVCGYTVSRRNLFLGRFLRYGGLYPDRKLRLIQRGRGRFDDRPVHESMHADGAVAALGGDLVHNTYPTLALYLEHMNRYSSTGAELARGRRAGSSGKSWPAFARDVVLNPVATFVYNYVLRGGFLDGREGLLQHLYHSCYVSWKYAKAWELSRPPRSQPDE